MSTQTTWRRRVGSLSRESVLLLALSALAFVIVVLVHPGRLFIDTRPDLYLAPGSLTAESLTTWVPGTGLGTPNYDNGYLPVAALLWLADLVGLPPWLSMRLWRWALLVAAAAGARALFRDLTTPDSGGAVGRTVAGVLYAVNPYVVVGAATTPVMLPYAMLPWLLLASRRSFARPWYGAALVGLVLFAMGGLNAGVVPAFMLLAVPLVAADAVLRERLPLGAVVRGVVASAVASALVSAYWVAGTLAALGTASTVADATEDPRTVAAVSSYAEVLRGLGSWLMYGTDALGPFRPGFTDYLDNPLTILASFTLPVLAFLGAGLSGSRLRGLGTALAVLGLVLMVGGHPPEDPSPLGTALLWGFDHVPGLVAFRTTSKAGALAMLGLAILAALGAETAWKRLRRRWRPWVVGAVVFGLVFSVTPVWFGRLFPGDLDIPRYWEVAAEDLDSRAGEGVVLAIPGETNAMYRWRPRGVDDFASVLLDRPVVYGRSFPDGPAGAWNLLNQVGAGLAGRHVPPTLVSTWSRYLGARDVLLRNDMLWERMGAPRPADLVKVLEADPGLRPSALYGLAGQNTVAPSVEPDPEEARLPPLTRYRVTAPTDAVRLYDGAALVLVAGDNGAFPSAVWSGHLDGDRPYLLMATASEDQVAAALDAGARVLLTDTNRRRLFNVHRLDISGPLLGENSGDEGVRALGEAADQTVAWYDGVAEVSATTSGSLFGPTPDGRPFLAVDGDPDTSWQFGDFGTAVGQAITITFDAPTSVRTLQVLRPQTMGSRVSELRVSAGEASTTARFGDSDRLTVSFEEPVMSSSLTLAVEAVTGGGANQVALSEIRLPGLEVEEFVRLPELPTAVEGPVDVLLTRAVAERERSLRRLFTLPAAARYELRAVLSGASPARGWRRCRPLLRIDGETVRARLAGREADDETLELRGCGVVSLTAGAHRLEMIGEGTLERLHLAVEGAADPAPASTDSVDWTGGGTSYRVEVPESPEDRFLVLAQAWDPRWRATSDGVDLGEPVQLNGFALGWPVPAGEAKVVEVSFTPQGPYRAALALSLLTVVGCVGLAVLGRRRRGGR